MSGEGLERFDVPNDTYGSFFVRVKPYSADYAKDVATLIKDRLAKQDIGVATFVYQDPDRHWGRAFMDGFTLVQQVLAVIAVLMGAVLVYNTLSNQITQQTNQIGILKAIGARSSTIAGVFLVSTFIFGLLALILALPLGAIVAYGVAGYFLNLFNIDFSTFQFSSKAIMLASRSSALDTRARRHGPDRQSRRHHGTAGDCQLWPGRQFRNQPH